MCFDTGCRKKTKPKAKIAKKDIICWKILSPDYTPRHYPLIIGSRHESYQQGYEYYMPITLTRIWREWTGHEGFHSYKYEPYSHRVVKFIIPKGARYYENYLTYLSNKIKMA